MPNFSNGTITQPAFDSKADPLHALGTLATTSDGRKYRYAKAGASALVVGNMLQAKAQNTDLDQLTPAAAAIGATQITVTLGSAGLTANQLADGLAIIDTTPGLGYAYKIKSHPAADASAAVVLTLYDEDAIQVALTTDSRVSLIANKFDSVIQTPVTTLTGACVGACIYPIAASQYGWIQTGGPAGVLIAGTPGVGLAVVVPATAAGAVVIDGAASATQVVGTMMVTGVDGKVLPVNLLLD
jgi:hypothetical protein